METLNFSLTVSAPPDGKWGKPPNDLNGTWDGLTGMLKRREIDMVSAGLGMNLARTRGIDYTMPLMEHQKTLIAPVNIVKN